MKILPTPPRYGYDRETLRVALDCGVISARADVDSTMRLAQAVSNIDIAAFWSPMQFPDHGTTLRDLKPTHLVIDYEGAGVWFRRDMMPLERMALVAQYRAFGELVAAPHNIYFDCWHPQRPGPWEINCDLSPSLYSADLWQRELDHAIFSSMILNVPVWPYVCPGWWPKENRAWDDNERLRMLAALRDLPGVITWPEASERVWEEQGFDIDAARAVWSALLELVT